MKMLELPNLQRIMHVFQGMEIEPSYEVPVTWRARFRIAEDTLNRFIWRSQELAVISSREMLRSYIYNNTVGARVDEGSLKCLAQVLLEFEPPENWK